MPCLFFCSLSVNQALGNSVVCMNSQYNGAFIYVKETSLQDEEAHVLHIFQTYFPSMVTQGRKYYLLIFHYPLIIPRVPVTSAKIKCGRGSAKDFISLQDSRTRSYEENVLKKMH